MSYRIALALTLLVTLTLSEAGAAQPEPQKAKVDYAALAEAQQWQWPAEEPGLLSSLRRYQGFYEAAIVRNPYANPLKLKITGGPWQQMEVWAGLHSVFVGWADRVYFVDWSPTHTGGYLRAYDLREDRWSWQVELPKLRIMAGDRAPLPRQRVHLELYRDVLMLWRKTNAEKVVEIIARTDGRTLGRKVFAADTETAAPGASPRPASQPDIIDHAPQTFGKWRYSRRLERAHSKSRRSVGVLTFDGKEISAKKETRFLWTPWGLMQSYGVSRFRCGWWPHQRSTDSKDINIVESPDPETSKLVRRRWAKLWTGLDAFALTLEATPASNQWASVEISVGKGQQKVVGNTLRTSIDRRRAEKLLIRLAMHGFLAKATEDAGEIKSPETPHYVIRVSAGDEGGIALSHVMKADLSLYALVHRLRPPQASLPADKGQALDQVLATWQPHLEAWRRSRRTENATKQQSP